MYIYSEGRKLSSIKWLYNQCMYSCFQSAEKFLKHLNRRFLIYDSMNSYRITTELLVSCYPLECGWATNQSIPALTNSTSASLVPQYATMLVEFSYCYVFRFACSMERATKWEEASYFPVHDYRILLLAQHLLINCSISIRNWISLLNLTSKICKVSVFLEFTFYWGIILICVSF